MPGIAGIICPGQNPEAPGLVRAMVATMKHEDFYRTSTHFLPETGGYAGFVGFENPADGVFKNETISLIFSGECFAGDKIADGNEIARLYQNHGEKFPEKLNGLFCGLLIDKQKQKVLLFNDRYGIQRIYFHVRDGNFYFASEAKALLRILPELRQFNPEGVADVLAFGCTLEWKTLFQGIEVMPGGSIWSFEGSGCRKEKYFSPESWESQPQLAADDFQERFHEIFKQIVPRYFETPSKIGVALTGGLDTRMIMACRPQNNGHTTSYTFSGANGRTLDDKIAARVAAASHLEHSLLRLDDDFFSSFASHVDKAVFVTDGCAGVFNAHEIYFNRKARQLAPVRLTGNYGSEILRGVSTFKPLPLSTQVFSPEWQSKINSRLHGAPAYQTHPMTFAAFKEIPWNLYGNLAAGRSQVQFRTPYLDNDLVSLAYQAPSHARKSSFPSFNLIRANNRALSEIPTDRGFAGNNSGLKFFARRFFAEATFKLDYYNSEGLPGALSPFDPLFKKVTSGLGISGLHKFLRYQTWFRHELAPYVRETFSGLQSQLGEFWNPDFVRHMAPAHVAGRKNYSSEINAILTLEAVDRLLFRQLPRSN